MKINNTIYNKELNSLDKHYDFKSLIGNGTEYNFNVSVHADSDGNIGIVLNNTFNNEEKYESSFIIDPFDAYELGKTILDYSTEAMKMNTIGLNINKNILNLVLNKDGIDHIQIRLRSNISKANPNDPLVHIYNVYPIFKNRELNKQHFNFNITCNMIGCGMSPTKLMRTMLHIDSSIKIKFKKCRARFKLDRDIYNLNKKLNTEKAIEELKYKSKTPDPIDFDKNQEDFLQNLLDNIRNNRETKI